VCDLSINALGYLKLDIFLPVAKFHENNYEVTISPEKLFYRRNRAVSDIHLHTFYRGFTIRIAAKLRFWS